MSPVASPCTRICTIEPDSGLCAGCGRTLAEIAGWMRLTANERRAIMAALPRRLAARAAVGTAQESAA